MERPLADATRDFTLKSKGKIKMNAVKEKPAKRDSRLFGVLQRVGRSFMLPIALLPIAGLLLGVGSSLTNAAMIESYGLENVLGEGTLLNGILRVLSAVGSIIFDNLPIIFAMGVALGMAESEKATATLSAAIAFFVMHATISTLLDLTGKISDGSLHEGSIADVVGITSLQMGVFGGIIVGLGVAALHNKFYKIKLPTVISFFGGTRFVPIISTVVYVIVGAVMFFVWPFIQEGIFGLGNLVLNSGYVGTAVYGFIERILIPFGLHHVFYLPFWQTGVGGSAIVDGTLIMGAQNIFFAELGSATTEAFSVSATRFMSGKFPFMIFGLPGAALAMYTCAKSKKRKVAGGLLLSASLTAMLTGITEPIEFTFLFVAPVLYFFHSLLAGLSYMLTHVFNVGVGMTFSGGIIDLLLFGVLQGNDKTGWVAIIPLGIVYFIVYFLLFRFMIRKFDYVTPGREDDGETKLYTRADYNEKKKGSGVGAPAPAYAGAKAEVAGEPEMSASAVGLEDTSSMIVRGLGGRDNIRDIDCCATRLRVTVHDSALVTDSLLKMSGAAGVIRRGNGVQVVYGPQVSVIKSELDDYLKGE